MIKKELDLKTCIKITAIVSSIWVCNNLEMNNMAGFKFLTSPVIFYNYFGTFLKQHHFFLDTYLCMFFILMMYLCKLAKLHIMASGEVSSPSGNWNILGYLIRKNVSPINFKCPYLNNQSQVEKTDFRIRMLECSSF